MVSSMEKKAFGRKIENVDYKYQKGVYAVIFNPKKDKIVTVHTGKEHSFLPGGGIEGTETDEECLIRELLEETGYEIKIGSFYWKSDEVLPGNQPRIHTK
jgi:8-oxo-dGTP diphosphatase